MKVSRAFATMAWLLWATHVASAQQPAMGPALLAVPQASVPSYPAVSSDPYATAYQATMANYPQYSASSYAQQQPVAPTSLWANRRAPSDAEPVPQPPADSSNGQYPSSSSPYPATNGSPYQGSNGFHEALTAEPNSGCTSCGNGDCAGGDYFGGDCCGATGPRWFGGIAGLFLNRDNPNRVWTTFETNNNPNQLMNFQNAETRWQGGFQANVGRTYGCSCVGWDITYWMLMPTKGSMILNDATGTGTLSTPFDMTNGNPTIGGVPAHFFFDGACQHQIVRHNQIYSLEVNLLQIAPMPCFGSNRFRVGFTGGFRWFRFDESLDFISTPGPIGNANGALGPAIWHARVNNNLFGVQFGARPEYFLTNCFSLFAAPKAGVFANNVSLHDTLNSPTCGLGFDINSRSTNVALLGQLDLGLNWYITPCWSVYAAYRAVGIAGVALADNQFPPFLADTPGIFDIKHNGNLILQGGIVGVQCSF